MEEDRDGSWVGIFLLVVGAILSFAVNDRVPNVDLTTVGYICMAAGLLSIIVRLVMNSQRNRSRHETLVEHRDTGLPPERRDDHLR